MDNDRTATDRTAIVTGGSRGLGRALAGQLVLGGWTVVIDGRDEDAVVEAAEQIGAAALPGDVEDPEHRAALVRAAVRLGGRLDLLVNNASSLGATPLPRLAGYPLPEWRAVFETNVVAPLGLIQGALAELRRSGGAVLNVTSDAALEGYPGWGGYGSSKAALEQLSRILAEEEPDLAVWWVDPGDMRTQMQQDAFPGEDISDRVAPEEVAGALAGLIAGRPPSGRIRVPELREVAAS